MCLDFIWRLNSLSANFGFCNVSTKRHLLLCRIVPLSMVYVSGTCKIYM